MLLLEKALLSNQLIPDNTCEVKSNSPKKEVLEAICTVAARRLVLADRNNFLQVKERLDMSVRFFTVLLYLDEAVNQ